MEDEKSNFNILIVDDEEGIRELFKMHFELEGFSVKTANCGNEALEILKNNKIDFIVSDVRMPNGSGDELLRSVRQKDPNLPVVVMVTGFCELSRQEAIEIGALDLLPKPTDLELLTSLVEKEMLRKRSLIDSK